MEIKRNKERGRKKERNLCLFLLLDIQARLTRVIACCIKFYRFRGRKSTPARYRFARKVGGRREIDPSPPPFPAGEQ